MKAKIIIAIIVGVILITLGVVLFLNNNKVQNSDQNQSEIITARFTCVNGSYIDAAFNNSENPKNVSLTLSDERKYTLPQVMSASGARYANQDESFVFWNKGDTAFIEEGGKTTFTDCLAENTEEPEPILVGGDKDEHGCLGSAGYSWCALKNKCLRVWEEPCEVNSANSIDKKLVIKNETTCKDNGGIWYSSEKICEINSFSTESVCVAKGGIFNPCASACRHDPKAEVCTMQCVLTCSFN
jgi:membrane-bound inhibitor of C-type lysozyme